MAIRYLLMHKGKVDECPVMFDLKKKSFYIEESKKNKKNREKMKFGR